MNSDWLQNFAKWFFQGKTSFFVRNWKKLFFLKDLFQLFRLILEFNFGLKSSKLVQIWDESFDIFINRFRFFFFGMEDKRKKKTVLENQNLMTHSSLLLWKTAFFSKDFSKKKLRIWFNLEKFERISSKTWLIFSLIKSRIMVNVPSFQDVHFL